MKPSHTFRDTVRLVETHLTESGATASEQVAILTAAQGQCPDDAWTMGVLIVTKSRIWRRMKRMVDALNNGEALQ